MSEEGKEESGEDPAPKGRALPIILILLALGGAGGYATYTGWITPFPDPETVGTDQAEGDAPETGPDATPEEVEVAEDPPAPEPEEVTADETEPTPEPEQETASAEGDGSTPVAAGQGETDPNEATEPAEQTVAAEPVTADDQDDLAAADPASPQDQEEIAETPAAEPSTSEASETELAETPAGEPETTPVAESTAEPEADTPETTEAIAEAPEEPGPSEPEQVTEAAPETPAATEPEEPVAEAPPVETPAVPQDQAVASSSEDASAGNVPAPAATLNEPQPSTAEQPEVAVSETTDERPEIVAAVPSSQPNPDIQPEANQPSFDLIRIDETGSGVIAGRADPGSVVQILAGDAVIGTAQASEGGEFVAFVQTPDRDEGQVLSLLASKGLEASESLEKVIVLPSEGDDQSPAAPTLVKADDTDVRVIQPSALGRVAGVTLDTISYDETGAVRLSGRAPMAQPIRIYVDGDPKGATRSSEAGTWGVVLSSVKEGRYVLRVDALGTDGKVTSRAESPFQRVFPTAEQRRNPTQVTVQPGNTLWVMAQDRYGSGFLYTQIFAANRSAIRDPDLIYPGQIFTLPTEDEFSR